MITSIQWVDQQKFIIKPVKYMIIDGSMPTLPARSSNRHYARTFGHYRSVSYHKLPNPISSVSILAEVKGLGEKDGMEREEDHNLAERYQGLETAEILSIFFGKLCFLEERTYIRHC